MLRTKRSRYRSSEKLFAAASRILPGGVDSPVRAFTSVGATPLFIERGRGAYIEDADGHTYIDYVMSWGPLIHGHAPKGLIKALSSAAVKGTSFGAPTQLETRLARHVSMLMPSIERIRFVSSGTEATMSAARVARAFTKRDKIVKFEGCYHGHADAFLVKAGSGAMTLGVPTSPGVPAGAAHDTLLARYNDPGSVERLFEQHREQIAAVIVEPIAGNMGVVPPRDGFLEGLRTICSREQSLLVFDEVISGFRAGAGGAQQLFGVKPDLTCLGKIIGGGLPVGAYGGRADLMRLVAPDGPVYQAGTLSGNPLAMAAGVATLGALDAELYAGLERAGERLETGLAAAAQAAGASVRIGRVASLLTLFVADGTFPAFFHAMLSAGFLLPPSQHEAWFISAAHRVDDLDATIDAAGVAFERMNEDR
jgi:glutamate-1-semialdehyde 2,1-aminomutase